MSVKYLVYRYPRLDNWKMDRPFVELYIRMEKEKWEREGKIHTNGHTGKEGGRPGGPDKMSDLNALR